MPFRHGRSASLLAAAALCFACVNQSLPTPTQSSFLTPAPTVTPAPTSAPTPSPTPTPSVGPTTSPSPPATSGNPRSLVLRMTSWTCYGMPCDTPEVVFALYGDGLVAYRQASDGQAMQAQLSQSEIDQLLAFAIGEGGMRDTESESAFSALSGVQFSIWSEELTRDLMILMPLERLLQSPYPSHQAIRDLAQRLVDFGTEVGDRAQAFAACAVTPAGSLPPAGASAVWQSAGAGIWVTAPDWYGVSTHDLLTLGFPSAAQDLELRWWLPDRSDETLAVHVERMSEGIGSGLVLDFNVWPDATRADIHERTVALPQLPPGCYDFSLEIGQDSGHLVERIRL